MPKPSPGPARNTPPYTRAACAAAALALCSFILSPASHAQLLDLDAPAAAPQGTGPAAAALADELQARITQDEPTAATDARTLALSNLRALARSLLLRGESLGDPGAPHVLAGRTLAARLDEIQAQLATLPPDDPALHILAADARRAANSVPADIPAMDRLLRDTLATVLQRLDPPQAPVGRPAGWVNTPDAPPAPDPAAFDAAIPDWSARPGVSPEAASALAAIADSLRAADAWSAYRPSAQHLRWLLWEAARTFDPNAAAAPLTSDPVRLQFALTFSEAAERLRDPETQHTALPALTRLASAAQALDLLAAIEPRPDRARRQATITGAVVQALAAPAGEPAEAERKLAALLRALRMIHAAEHPSDDARLVRQLRPAHRALAASARRSAGELFDALPRLAQNPDALTDPGMLSALANHGQTLDDIALVERLSTLLQDAPTGANPAPTVARGLERTADRLLTLGQQLGREGTRDAALAELRAFGQSYPRLRRLPGEPSLARAAEPGAASADDVARWRDLTGSLHAQLAAAIRTQRESWLDAWADAESDRAAPHADRLETLHGLMALLDAARTLGGSSAAAPAPTAPRINAWPGWELSPEALTALIDDLRPSLPEATAVALSDDANTARRRVTDLTHAHAALLLVAALERRSLDLGIGAPDVRAPGLRELGTGGPSQDRAWLAELRPQLALIARAAEEWAASPRISDRAATEQWAEYLRAGSADLLRLLPPE